MAFIWVCTNRFISFVYARCFSCFGLQCRQIGCEGFGGSIDIHCAGHRACLLKPNLIMPKGTTPGFWLDETGTGNKGAYFVLDANWMQVQRRSQGFGAYETSPIFINIGAPGASFYVNASGYVGFGLNPSYPLHMASGAFCSTGGSWYNASSREYKKDIKALTTDEAVDTLKGLNPVKFNYKASSDEHHVGFIAEDVPELVATKDRKGMSSMDVVAVLTKVVQDQQKTIAELSKKMTELERELKLKNDVAMVDTDLSPSVVK